MATTSDLDRVAMIVLRYMRRPFFTLVAVYAVGITGMALIPGREVDGHPVYMSLFHAFYFFTYTATTTGFGEIPSEFSEEQRLWAVFCLYTGVIAWFYAIGSVVRLLQNPHFIQAVNEHRFARVVGRITDPFFIICGFGDTGSLLARGLSDHYLGAVVIDRDPERIKALALRDYRVKMPGLCADASVPKHLVDAGVKQPNCRGVVILNKDEDINLKIAVMAKYLNPRIRIILRSTSPRHQELLSDLEGVTVVDPFEIFAQLLTMAITIPQLHNLNRWLVRAKRERLGHPMDVPDGGWILCGYGRMGQWIHKHMTEQGIHSTVIDPEIEADVCPAGTIRDYVDRDTLQAAGVHKMAGIVAGTDQDADNLSILMCAQTLNPNLFAIVRQNNHENQIAFDAANVNLILQPSLTTARRILKILISPLIQLLIDYLSEQDPGKTEKVVSRLRVRVGERTPLLWRTNLCRREAAAAFEYLGGGQSLTLGALLRDPHDLNESLSCVPLVIQRGSEYLMLPADSECVQAGDEILFCGSERGAMLLAATLNNPYTLHYVATGEDAPRGYLFEWLARWRNSPGASSSPA